MPRKPGNACGTARSGRACAGLRRLCGLILLAAANGAAALPANAAEATAACPTAAPLALRQDPQWIHGGLQALQDPSPGYGLEQVLAAPFCQQFRAVPGAANFGYRTAAVWLRFGLPPGLREEPGWRVLVLFGQLDRVCLHWPVAPSPQYQSDCADHRQPMNSGARTRQGWYFAVPAGVDSARPVLLHARGGATLKIRMALGTADAFVSHLYLRQSWLGTFHGLILGIAVLGLVIYRAQRDRTLLYFSATIVLFTLYLAVDAGHGGPMGFVGRLANWLSAPLVAGTMLVGTLFYQRFLESVKYARRLHRALLILALLFQVPAFLEIVLPNSITVPSRIALGVLWLLVLLAMLLVRLRQGSRPAIYVLLAWSCFGSAGIVDALDAMGVVLMRPQWLSLAYSAGNLLLSMVLAMGLVDRMRQLARERDQAQELAASSQQLALYRAHYDPVTHLPNRTRLREYVQERLLQRSSAERYALVTMGLDRFGQFKDALGHDIGESVLGEIAKRLHAVLGGESLLARVGLDLFAWWVEVPAGGALQSLYERCEALQETVTAPLHLADGARLSASFGIALCPDHAASAEQLLQCSDAALQRAKTQGPGSVQLFDPGTQRGARRSLELGQALRRALEDKQLDWRYEPIISLQSGQLLGVEALLHWIAPDGHRVSPHEIVSLAQSSELLLPITEWALQSYRAQLGEWQARGAGIPYVSFNLTAQQLHLPGIEDLIARMLGRGSRAAEGMVIEVCEGSLLDNLQDASELLRRLRQQGIRVALDDFGTGYASPDQLRRLPLDFVKIDAVFLRNVPHQAEAETVLGGLITIGQSLGVEILAQCVDSEAQRQYLASRGVNGAQGRLFGRALSAAALEAWLQKLQQRAA